MPDADPQTQPTVDRLCSRLGAGRIVEGRPGLGWMLIEFFPVAVWSRITGAINLENSFYLVGYLTLLGASAAERSWIMVLYGLAVIAHTVHVLGFRRGGGQAAAKRQCVAGSWLGRSAWIVAVLWPLAAEAWGLDRSWGLGGLFIGIFISQFFFFTSLSAWTTWTRDLVDEEIRGPFFAWRNISALVAIALVTALVSWLWPDVPQEEERLWWYGLLFGSVSLFCLVATWWLARAPVRAESAEDAAAPSLPLLAILASARPFWRYAVWNILHTTALACTLVYTPDLIRAAGFDTDDFALLDFCVRTPVALVGLLIAGRLLARLGSHRLLLLMNLSLVGGLLALLGAAPAHLAWLVPIGIAAEGIGRSMNGVAFLTRLYEVIPRGDQRLPALFLGIGAVAMTTTALLTPLTIDWLAATWPDIHPAWILVGTGVVLRTLALPLIWDDRRWQSATDSPRTSSAGPP